VRPQQPGYGARPGMPPRPGMSAPGSRPGQPGGYRPTYRPQGGFGGQRRTSARPSDRPQAIVATTPPPPITKSITLAEGMTVKDLADKLDARVKDVLKKLLEQGKMMTINSTLDSDTATAVAREFGADMQMRTFEEEMVDVESAESRPEDLGSRAPVVTVMGHVDHGKTTLLDAIRETRVAEREAGGITQHIGAYNVQVGDRSVVFLDTPGHEAFTMMRSRGAKVTDVVVLVVAADDGVMPQTKEAINHAKAAAVPIVVAVNKIDKTGANPDNVKRELAELGLVPESWGGNTVTVDVSAKKRQNLDLLLEMILLSSDILELKANPKKAAMGTVLEAKLDRGRGPVATILVQDGTLRVGDNFIAGSMVGKVRALIDDRGRQTKQAGPSTPVEVLGLTGLPQPGDTFQSIADAAKARQIALFRQEQAKVKALGAKGSRLTLESLKDAITEGGVKELPLIVKADVQGSAEVLADSLQKLSDERVKIRIIHSGVGAINEFDVLLASAGNAIVIGFNVRPDRNAADVAERENVDIRLHSVIYNVTEEIKKAMTGLLEPTLKEARLGSATVRELFKVPKVGTIAGCMVTDGRITRSGDAQARLLRDNVVVHEGKISSLRRFKDDVSEVKAGFECGIAFERYNDLKVGDVIEVFVIERVATPA
jgi:translation initiation factor IF-2